MFRSPLKRRDGVEKDRENDAQESKRRRVEPRAATTTARDANDDKSLDSFPVDSCRNEYFDPKKPAHFVDYHFNLLRSLYDNDKKETTAAAAAASKTSEDGSSIDKDSNDGTTGDTPIPEKTWSIIERFLRERVQILQAKQAASCWSAVHREALVGEASGSAFAAINKAVTASPSKSTLRTLPGRSPAGDHAFRPFSQRSATSPMSSRNNHHQTTGAAGSTTTSRSGSFSIVARLLGKHAVAVGQRFQHQAFVYQSLSVFIEQRVGCLQENLKTLQQTMDEEDFKRMGDLMSIDNAHQRNHVAAPSSPATSASEKDRSQLLALRAKIRLWSLLAADLKDIA